MVRIARFAFDDHRDRDLHRLPLDDLDDDTDDSCFDAPHSMQPSEPDDPPAQPDTSAPVDGADPSLPSTGPNVSPKKAA